MGDPKTAAGDAGSSTGWSRHVLAITQGDPSGFRSASSALIADRQNGESIVSELLASVQTAAREQLYLPNGDLRVPAGHDIEHNNQLNAVMTRQQAAIQTMLGIVGPARLLDDPRFREAIDYSQMLTRLGDWQRHIADMQQAGSAAADRFKDRYPRYSIERVQLFGVGGSAAPHDIVAEIVSNFRKVGSPLEVIHADTPNPDFTDEGTLVVLASFSGNTEEVHHCYHTIKDKGGYFVALTEGGDLAALAADDANRFPIIQLPKGTVKQPRESVCLQMTGLLAFLASLGLHRGSHGSLATEDLEFATAQEQIVAWRKEIGPDIPFEHNPAKQLAFFLLYGTDDGDDRSQWEVWNKRTPFVLADRNNAALAHEVRTQLHERSKINAAFYEAPEFLHNLVESIRATSESSRGGLDADRWVYYFIRSASEEPRITERLDRTIERVLQHKCRYAEFDLEVANPFHRALLTTYFNAHMTTYLALLNGSDPLPVPTMSWIKNVMATIGAEDALPRPRPAEGRFQVKMHRP